MSIAAVGQQAKVVIGHPPATDFLAVFVAKEKGFFEKHNIDATITRLPVVTNIPPAIVSGSVQLGDENVIRPNVREGKRPESGREIKLPGDADVPGAALLLTTIISSTSPVA
jgi:hypothetical protein